MQLGALQSVLTKVSWILDSEYWILDSILEVMVSPENRFLLGQVGVQLGFGEYNCNFSQGPTQTFQAVENLLLTSTGHRWICLHEYMGVPQKKKKKKGITELFGEG